VKALCHDKEQTLLNRRCIESVDVELACGHTIRESCYYKDLVTCNAKVKVLLECGHEAEMPCGDGELDVRRWKCIQNVDMKLACGHTKKAFCSRKSLVTCNAKVKVSLECGHEADMPCGNRKLQLRRRKCMESVDVKLACGHTRKAFCYHKSLVKCNAKVKVSLECGHEAEVPCGDGKLDSQAENYCKQCRRFIHRYDFPSQ
jgi:hypothetical protein